MKAYVINLDRDTHRLEKITETLAKAGLEWERVSAVAGSTIDQHIVDRHHRAGITPLSANEVGCLLSHQKAMDLLLSTQDDYALILEDDVCVADYAKEGIDLIGRGISDHAIIKVETSPMGIDVSRDRIPFGGRYLHDLKSFHLGTAAYIVRRDAAKILRDRLDHAATPADYEIFRELRGELKIAQAIPSPFIQDRFLNGDNGDSSIGTRDTQTSKRRGVLSRILRPLLIRGLNLMRYRSGIKRVNVAFG